MDEMHQDDNISLLCQTSSTFKNSLATFKKFVPTSCSIFLIVKYLLIAAIFAIFLLYQLEFVQLIRSDKEYSIRLDENGTKWIVVTSIRYPTEDIKRLVSEGGWHLVVVGDKKTPKDWNCPGAHFLSIEKQRKLFPFAKKLPNGSYTRKNIGYLYAIMNGATWIYDTDDDNKPYALGLRQFDYSMTISGMRYISKSENISEKLFNPYKFFGFKDMWPRGFPLEHLKGHSNGKDRMISCRHMKAPAVQQGIVHNDPDVDAIYRLMHADKETGLNVKFSDMAPAILLEEGTYAPWNSQNTLFHQRAFFAMFLPTTVDFRVTDIWRSYFAQKLLHLTGNNVAFYPVNAVQYRNKHNYLQDFHEEIDVYEKSGRIVEFIDKWNCTRQTTPECTIELAEEFVKNEFFEKKDLYLIKGWIKSLYEIGYKFPVLQPSEILFNGTKELFGNCREVNLDLTVTNYDNSENKEEQWAQESLNQFTELLQWCNKLNETFDFELPDPETFHENYMNKSALFNKKDTAFVLVNNYPWKNSIGLLQRLYKPFFKHLIFCGTWNPEDFAEEDLKRLEPISFVNLTKEEMSTGYNYGYCISKVRDLRLSNVTGYYFTADDAAFNIWLDIPLDKVVNPRTTVDDKFWWRDEFINKTLELIEGKYKDDVQIQHTWKWFQEGIIRKYGPQTDTRMHFIKAYKSCLSDFYYLPQEAMNFFGDMMEVFAEGHVMVESAMGKLLDIIDYEKGGPQEYLWGSDRLTYYVYNKTMLVLHPIKTSGVHNNSDQRTRYCSSVVTFIAEECYGANITLKNSTSHAQQVTLSPPSVSPNTMSPAQAAELARRSMLYRQNMTMQMMGQTPWNNPTMWQNFALMMAQMAQNSANFGAVQGLPNQGFMYPAMMNPWLMSHAPQVSFVPETSTLLTSTTSQSPTGQNQRPIFASPSTPEVVSVNSQVVKKDLPVKVQPGQIPRAKLIGFGSRQELGRLSSTIKEVFPIKSRRYRRF